MEQETHKPIKPILVTDPDDSGKKEGRRRSVRWDEEGIEAHDKERGKTMKITEPKTPYVDSLSDDDLKEMTEEKPEPFDNETKENTIKNKHLNQQIDIDSLNTKILEKAQDWEKQQENKEKEEKEQEEMHHDFVEKRKKHYNEGQMMKALLKKNWTPDDEEDG